MSTTATLRLARLDDASAQMEIYNDVIQHSAAIYEDHLRDLSAQQKWLIDKERQNWPVLVAEVSGTVIAYGTLGPFRTQTGYATTAEHSLYVARSHRGHGLGALVLAALIQLARERGLHALIGAVDSNNEASLRLHRNFHFREVGRMPEVAKKFDLWSELVFVQLTL